MENVSVVNDTLQSKNVTDTEANDYAGDDDEKANNRQLTQTEMMKNVYGGNLFETARQIRKKYRLFSTFLDDEPPSSGENMTDFMSAYALQKGKYQLTPQQIEWFYPQSKSNENFDILDEALSPNTRAEEKFLQELVPEKIPPDDYFEPEETHALLGGDSPLNYPIKHFISK